MKISQALVGVQRLYFDTSPFIYFVENHPVYADKMQQIIEDVNSGKIESITSVITLAETLTKPLQTGDKVVEQAYRTLLQQTQHLILVSVTPSIAERTAELRARHGLKTPDALHIAAAIDAHCDAFLTNDLRLRRVSEISILVLDELEVDQPKQI